jgi:hypothetical protein
MRFARPYLELGLVEVDVEGPEDARVDLYHGVIIQDLTYTEGAVKYLSSFYLQQKNSSYFCTLLASLLKMMGLSLSSLPVFW